MQNRVLNYTRQKTGSLAVQRFGDKVYVLLKSLSKAGPLFPKLSKKLTTYRSTRFSKLCKRNGITGVTLHSYRYAWAERAKRAGYPERFAQEALGHNSQAVHRAYARMARVDLPALEDFEAVSVMAKD